MTLNHKKDSKADQNIDQVPQGSASAAEIQNKPSLVINSDKENAGDKIPSTPTSKTKDNVFYSVTDCGSARDSISLCSNDREINSKGKVCKIIETDVESDSNCNSPDSLSHHEEKAEDGDVVYSYDASQLPPSSEVALVAMSNGGKYTFTQSEVKQLLRQYDKHILTFLCFLYFLSHLDRGNIGNAKLAGMGKDLNLEGHEFTIVVIVFFIGYILFQWGIILWKVIRPNLFAPWVIIGWGIISTCSAAVQNWKQLLALRFLLGAFEACFSPGIYYYFSFFYQRSEIAKRVGIFQSFSPISSAVSGSIAYGITEHAPKSIAPWRLLFIVEGLPSIVGGLIAFYAICNGPQASRFLSDRQKQIASIRTLEQSGSINRGGRHFDIREALDALLDIKIWSTTVLFFCVTLCQTPVPIFLPTIVKGMGFHAIEAQGLTAPPYIVAVFAILLACYVSDKYMQRAYVIVACMLYALIGYLLMALGPNNASRYLGLFFAVPGVYAGLSIIVAWTGDNQGSDSKRGISYIILHIFGMTGPIVGITLFPNSEAPRYVKGIWITTSMVVFIIIASIAFRWYLMKENKKRDQIYGTVLMKDLKKCNDDTQPNFRYVL